MLHVQFTLTVVLNAALDLAALPSAVCMSALAGQTEVSQLRKPIDFLHAALLIICGL